MVVKLKVTEKNWNLRRGKRRVKKCKEKFEANLREEGQSSVRLKGGGGIWVDMKGGGGPPVTSGWEAAVTSGGQAAGLLPLDTGLVLGAPRCLGTVDSLILILGFLLARL